jgi:hypothetical protein
MTSSAIRLLVAGLIIGTAGRSAPAAAGRDFQAGFRNFSAKHCVECHGPEVQRRQLRLDTLPLRLADKDTADVWMKILDRLERGEMPPKKNAKPPEQDVRVIVTALRQQLIKASRDRQLLEGRVVLRRLNRTEYETTLHDLLGIDVALKDLLPDDNSAAGFDKVSAVLDISAAHLLRYQAAAEKALRAALPNRPQLPAVTVRRTGRQVTEQIATWRTLLGKTARLEGDTLVMCARPYAHVPCETTPVPVAGRYRVRASVYAIGTNGQSLAMLWTRRRQYGVGDNEQREVYDVPANKPTVIEREVDFKDRGVINISCWSLMSAREAQDFFKARSVEKYGGAGLAVEWLETDGPLDHWPTTAHERLFGGLPIKPASVVRAETEGRPAPQTPAKRPANWWLYDPLVPLSKAPKDDAARLMRSFLPLAFRRPVSSELQEYYIKITHDGLDRKLSFTEAMLLGYKAALSSPHFLFLTEPVNAKRPEGPTALDDYAVASRLSYFIWSSMPDTELLQLAARGELRKPGTLRAQVERMLNDPRGRRFTTNFAGQWLDLRNINATTPDPQVYGEFDEFLFWSMPRETEMFFEEILRADRSLTEFTHSDWTFLNQRLAQHYGIPNVHGGELRKVKLIPDSHRGGVLTQAAILKVTADGTKTSPVLRGKWVLERIVGQPPAPPPPDVPSIEPDIRGATTIRQQLDKHRNTPACASCHRHIDPPGFALETFDVIGGWREFYRASRPTRGGAVDLPTYPKRRVYRGMDVEKGGETPDGKPFKDIDDYKQFLLADKDQLTRSLVNKLIVFATGADVEFADHEVVEQLVAQSRAKNYGFRSLIHDIVQSRVFLEK